MILSEFPDLSWLKHQIDNRFQNRRGYAGQPLDSEGFPSVIIRTAASSAYRPHIMGPISLFSNTSGTSACTVDNRRTLIPERYFFISNCYQEYTLEIEKPAQTCNIHIGEVFSQQAAGGLITTADAILNSGKEQKQVPLACFNKLYRIDASFHLLVGKLASLQGAFFHKD